MEPYIPSFFSIKVGGVKFFGDPLGVNCLDHVLVDEESLRLEEEEHLLISSLEDNMPFLQMLQSVESPQFFPLKETNFQTLLRLQHKKNPWEGIAYFPRMEAQQVQAALELESCVTHDMSEMQYSPVKSESNELQHPLSVSCFEKKVNYECNQEPQKVSQTCPKSQPTATKERRKRKRTRPSKNKEDVENQRMTHIAVERNRRRQMNDHLSVLRSLMPPSYIQRGDQASIIGGAIDFVKELEQLLQSLEAQKRTRKNEEGGGGGGSSSSSSSTMLCKPPPPPLLLLSSPHGYGMRSSPSDEVNCGDEVKAENKSEAADIKVTLIQTHVNLKIECQRKPGQLLKVIVALEDLRLTILHLNITSSETSVLYSLNLKIEEDCKLCSASDIAETVHQIFSFINGVARDH
ncbi:transcription factor bHLH57 isoform X1 [Glycine max]|uniref:transcription factor bHLH57 isoform X1 n=1 Tax=Glycine max TaxID=3847 RepID=UPI000E21BB66|nr:transcription factor bHLH57 isoform X1 [Glycine max]|eukprot:XP_025981990.1 transcription factor bHLH57 isoform X1 [Glycine max]